MANKKISELTAYAAPVSGDVVPINDTSTTTTKKITVDNLFNILSSLFRIKDSSDTTKKLAFSLSGVTTGTTRTLTVPDASTTIVGTDTAQTLTNKTITSPVITSPTLTVGSDATGDLYYRAVGGFTRLAIGTANYVLRSVGGVPTWSAETTVSAATSSSLGSVELATAAEITAGTATGSAGPLAVTPDQLAISSPAMGGANITGITRVLNTVTTDVTFSSSTAENTLLSYSVPGGTLGTGNFVRVTMHVTSFGVTVTNSATFRFKYGATTIATKTYTPTAASATLVGKIEFLLVAAGATGSQNGSYFMNLGNADYVGNGNTQIMMFSNTAQGTSSEDSTAAKTLAITCQHSNSNANDNITVSLITVEKIA